MATHNVLLKLDGDAWPDAYLEIIAIDPSADQPPAAGRARWFGLDDPRLRQSIAQSPQLVHFVARSADIVSSRAALMRLGEDTGEVVAASRSTPDGELRWQISVRADGRPQHRGALPTLIQWHGLHPARQLVSRGVSLRSLTARSTRPAALRRAWDALGLDEVQLTLGEVEPALEAVLQTPRGELRLRGGGI